jgi:hypothetical protein
MNNVSVVADKKINTGFKLFESDVRRLVQLSLEQIQKTDTGTSHQQFFLKFENGTVAKSTLIEDIFIEDNLGSNKIIMLQVLTSNIEITDKDFENQNDKNSIIRITFNNLNSENNSESYAIRYKIGGFSRDWVMVTSSLIEERLTKLQRKRLKLTTRSLIPIVMVMTLIMLLLMLPNNESVNSFSNKLSTIESNYKAGKITNTNELIIAIEKAKDVKLNAYLSTKFIFMPVLLLALLLVNDMKIFSFNRLYPLYNFCWGDYLDEYKKIEKRRRFLIWLILGIIILGVAINLLSNIIWKNIN